MSSYGRILPSFQELVRTCNKERLVRHVASQYPAQLGAEELRQSLKDGIGVAADALVTNICAADATGEGGYVALPYVHYSYCGGGVIRRTVRAAYLSLEGDLREMGYAPRSWDSLLTCSVWFGEESDLDDRYSMLADMCWHLLARGSSKELCDAKDYLAVEECAPDPEPLWSSGLTDQWDFEERDWVEEFHKRRVDSSLAHWNAVAQASFLAEVTELELYCAFAA